MASVFTITTGETLNTHERFKSHLSWGSYKNVSNSKDCDVILAFCPVTSRVGTDIEAALRVIPEGKPLALVVLHHTLDSNYTLPDTKRFMKRPDSITVDCLFTDDGLMRCPCNDDAVRAVAKFLQHHGKCSPRGKLALGLLILILLCVAISTFSYSREQAEAELIQVKNELELMQQNYKTLEGKLSKREIVITSFKEEVENYKELDRKAKKEINSLKVDVKNYKESNRVANEKITSLKEQVEKCNESEREANEKISSLKEDVKNCEESDKVAKKEIKSLGEEVDKWKALDREANEKISSLKEDVKNCKELDIVAKREINSLKEDVKNCKESNLILKKKLKGNDEIDEIDKHPDVKGVIYLIGVSLVMCLVWYIINRRGGETKNDDRVQSDKKGEEDGEREEEGKGEEEEEGEEGGMKVTRKKKKEKEK